MYLSSCFSLKGYVSTWQWSAKRYFANQIDILLSKSEKLAKSHEFLLQASKLEQQSPIKEGSISQLSGFLPSAPIPARMPTSHETWEKIAESMPLLLRHYQFVSAVEKMPLLDADFEDKFLDRASMLISALAHGYCFQEKKSLPPQLEIPWLRVTKRLKRDHVMRSVSDDFLHNWQYKNPALPNPMQFDNLTTLFPYFYEQEDKIMNLTVTMTEHQFAPALSYIVAAQTAICNEEDERVLNCLQEIVKILRKVSKMFSHLSPNQYASNYVDPIVWAKTFAIVSQSTRDGELGNSGVSLPLFHVMDAFIGRVKFNSELGSQMVQRSLDLPQSHKDFISLIRKISLHKYVKESKNNQLKIAFDQLIEAYAGDDGLLNEHRKKAFCYIKLAMLSGRTTTNNETVGKKLAETDSSLFPWEKINSSFHSSNAERTGMHCNGKYHNVLRSEIVPLSASVNKLTLFLEDVSQWQPGDKIRIIPENSKTKIKFAIEILGLDPNLELRLSDSWQYWWQKNFKKNLQTIHLQSFLKYADLKDLSSVTDADVLSVLLQPLHERLYSLTAVDTKQKTISFTIDTQQAQPKCPFRGKIASSYLATPFIKPAISHIPSYLFTLPENPHAKIIIFAAGIGIAPFMHYIKKSSSSSKLYIYYSVKSKEDFIYGDELIELCNRNNLKNREFGKDGPPNFHSETIADKQDTSEHGNSEEKPAQPKTDSSGCCDIELKVIFSENGEYLESSQDIEKIHKLEKKGVHFDYVLNQEKEQLHLRSLLKDENTYVYFCGSTGFYRTVHDCLQKAVSADKLYQLVAQKRYIPEVYDKSFPSELLQQLTLVDVAMHNQLTDCYIVIHQKVYDLSKYMHLHPGGIKIIMAAAGTDASRDFQIAHAKDPGVFSQLQMYSIANLQEASILVGKDLYERNLKFLQSVVELQNNQFNYSEFFGREIPFRLLEQDIIPFYVKAIQDVEIMILGKASQHSFHETIEQTIIHIKNLFQSDPLEAEKVSQEFMKRCMHKKLKTLGEIKNDLHKFLKELESNVYQIEELEMMQEKTLKSISKTFNNYWSESLKNY